MQVSEEGDPATHRLTSWAEHLRSSHPGQTVDFQKLAGKKDSALAISVKGLGKQFLEAAKMQTRTPPTGNKTSWSKQSAVLLINIVKDVEQKILKKELLVGKEKTKWDYVAECLHEASVSDTSKTPNNCQYKFWELNRQFKFLLKETVGKTGAEEKEGPIFSALKGYYGNSPCIKKKGRLQRRIALFKGSRNESERQVSTDSPLQLMNVDSKLTVSYPTYESEDDSGGSLPNVTQEESVGHLATTSQAEDQPEDGSAGSLCQHGNGEVDEQLKKPNPKGRPRSKRKAIDVQGLDLVEVKEEDDSSYRLKQLVEKMARLTSYMKWKETGVGEDWRCDFTDRIERRQKRGMRKSVDNSNSAHVDGKMQALDEIETALREDILSFWNELDKKRPSAEECHKYYLKKYAGEVNY